MHIVLLDAGLIIPRMAGWLHERLGWTLSTVPDPEADVNYYMPYLAYKPEYDPGTPTAAWFTHYEPDNVWKRQLWDTAAEMITYPIITSDLYRMPAAIKVTPGIDTDFFTPRGNASQKRLIGVSGEASPRKGLQLAAALRRIYPHRVLITGHGDWPGGVNFLQWGFMPHFYSSLEVYVCTSLIEGIPAPPLEALSCGTKIVIPVGVGMLDELPDITGIYRYERGSEDDLLTAVSIALEDDVPPERLRSVAMTFGIDQWVWSHQKALSTIHDYIQIGTEY